MLLTESDIDKAVNKPDIDTVLYEHCNVNNTGDTEGDPVIDAIRDIILPPSEELLDCQAPKPVLLPTGEVIPILILI